MPQRPNILIVMAEQVSAFADPNYAPACGVDAPAVAQLAGESTRFERAYCNAPVCGPSRLSFMTGRLPHRIGAYDNGSILPPHVPTFAHVLTGAGYETAICGRMHVHGLDQHVGFERRLSSEIINPLLCNPADHPSPLVPIGPAPQRADAPFPAPEFSDSPLFDHDAYVTQQACNYLRSRGTDGREGDDKPFCLLAGYFAAHPGAKVNRALEPLYGKYIQRELPIASFTPDDYERLPDHAKRLIQQRRKHSSRLFDPDWQRQEMALYYAGVEFVDQQLGRLLRTLDETGLADQTVVIYVADHGETMGRHGLWGKMVFYEESTRVPMYIRTPARQPRTVAEPVSLVDMFPTIAEVGGAPITFPIDGCSLLPIVEGRATQANDTPVVGEYHGYCSASDMYMIVAGGWKYCHYLLEPGELYNLRSDPAEQVNRTDDPAAANVLQRLRAILRQHIDVDAVAGAIAEHNAQRDAVASALASSAIIQQRSRDHIARFRAELNEPWWDGGQYVSAWEPKPPPGSK